MCDDKFTNYGTEQDRVDQYTSIYGAERPQDAWISSPYDTWEKNPYYIGEDNPPHPYDDEDETQYCQVCAGTGEGQHDGTRCFSCRGSGIVNVTEENEE